MIDPHISGSYGNFDEGFGVSGVSGYGEGFGGRPSGYSGFGGEGGIDIRANRLYQSLEKAGRYAELDKAKRNEHYRAYLLENFDDSENEYY
ncbi:MAG: hypothetical protein MJ092_08030 [Lachnospiraceae bacterium]|nr:hypothetical protein [Lachnospiraceae bacterium]